MRYDSSEVLFDVCELTPSTVFDKTVRKNPFIASNIFPTDIQSKFLQIGNSKISTPNIKTEVFLRGAGSSGKTTALLLAALQYTAVKDYQALLLRAHPPPGFSLSGMMKSILGSHYENIRKTPVSGFEIWQFPSGEMITFGYVDTFYKTSLFKDYHFHFIGFDELPQFQESDYYSFYNCLQDSPSNRIPLRIYSTGNPEGPNRLWVKKRLIDCPKDRMKRENRFVLRALIEDNPYRTRDEIERYLKELDPITKERILNDNWDI